MRPFQGLSLAACLLPSPCVFPAVSLGPGQRVWLFWKPLLCLLSLVLPTPCPSGEIWNVLLSALARGIKGVPRDTAFSEARMGAQITVVCSRV